jgi:hypothetical protein
MRFPRESSHKAPKVTSLTSYRCRTLKISAVKLKKARLYHLWVTRGSRDKVMEVAREILICSSKVHIKDSRRRKGMEAICIFQTTLTLMQTRIKELTRAVKTEVGQIWCLIVVLITEMEIRNKLNSRCTHLRIKFWRMSKAPMVKIQAAKNQFS